MIILNSFSLNMVSGFPAKFKVTELKISHVVDLLTTEGVASAVGHADTAALFTAVLGIDIPCNRATVSLKGGDSAIVGQYSGPRLPEGCTTLPEGATIKWLLVEVI